MADVPGVAGATVIGRAVEHQPAADPGRHHHAEKELGAAPRATPALPHRHAEPVAAQPNRRADDRGHPVDDRKAAPLGDIDRAYCPRRHVDRPGRRDADTAHRTACRRQRLGDQRIDRPPISLRRHRRASAASPDGPACRRRRRDPRRSSCRRCRLRAWFQPSVPVGVVGLARVAGMLIAGGQLDERGASGIQPQPERATPGRGAQVLGDARGVGEAGRIPRCVRRGPRRRSHRRLPSRSRTTPAPTDRLAPRPQRCRSRTARPYRAATGPLTVRRRRSTLARSPRRPPPAR